MDEFIRPVIKDKDTEEKLRSLYAKGYSFDVVMPKYKDLKEKYQDVDQKYKTLTDNISMLETHLNQGDFDGFFNTLRIPEQSIYKWVLDKLNYQELPPEQRQQFDSYRQAQQQKIMLEREYSRLQQQHEQMSVQARTMELNTVMSRPDVSSVASNYDQRMGKEGAFRDLVIERGQLAHWRSEGKVDLTPEEAVREALALVGEMQQQAQQAAVSQAPQVPANQAQAKPPVIPTVQGKGSSTVRKIPKTLDDIKRMAQDAGA